MWLDVAARSVKELIALARMRPDYLSFGSSGVGSGSHFSGELFNVMAGVKIQHGGARANQGQVKQLQPRGAPRCTCCS
jgi:tripartite-type tricarboxylate transporter receptor subunit TctC